MTPENLAALAGVILSLLFSYSPKLSDWYAGLTSQYKRLILLLAVGLIGAAAVGVSCGTNYFGVTVAQLPACTQSGVSQLVAAILAAFVSSQATYTFTPTKAGGAG